MLYAPVNNHFLFKSGRVFLVRTDTKQRIKYLAQGHMYSTVTTPAVSLELATIGPQSNALLTDPLCSATSFISNMKSNQ